MNKEEQKGIDAIQAILSAIRTENQKFREDIGLQVAAISAKVESKTLPYDLEGNVVNVIKDSIEKALAATLTGYNSPLTKYAENIIKKYQSSIEGIFDKIVSEGIQTEEFKTRVKEVFLSKIAKTVISGIDGSIDKTINLMKQDAIFRSKLTLAVNGLVEEFLSK